MARDQEPSQDSVIRWKEPSQDSVIRWNGDWGISLDVEKYYGLCWHMFHYHFPETWIHTQRDNDFTYHCSQCREEPPKDIVTFAKIVTFKLA